MMVLSALLALLGLAALTWADSREECDLTFSIPSDQLQSLCQRTGRTPESMIQNVQADFEAVKTENTDLRAEIASLKAEYSGVLERVERLRADTAVWREVVEWPPVHQPFRPNNDSLVYHDNPTYTDCQAARQRGERQPGVYALQPEDTPVPFLAFCEDGWTVIQRRYDGTVDFFEGWDGYAGGFGDRFGEFWLGLANMHRLTRQKDYELVVEALGWNDKLYRAEYPDFYVGDEEGDFTLSIGNMTDGNSEDFMGRLNGLQFTAHDRDHDEWDGGNCADYYRGGWWLHNCGFDPNRQYCDGRGCMTWGERPVKKFLMKVKPMGG